MKKIVVLIVLLSAGLSFADPQRGTDPNVNSIEEPVVTEAQSQPSDSD